VLSGRSPPTVVRVVDSPSHGYVKVRLESGVKKGSTTNVSTRRIAAPRAQTTPSATAGAQPSKQRPRAARRRVLEARIVLAVGQTVTLPTTADVVWTIRQLHPSASNPVEATIESELFGQPQSKRVPVADLAPAHRQACDEQALTPSFVAELRQPPARPARPPHGKSGLTAIRPEAPVRELDAILAAVDFSPRCLGIYRNYYAPDVSWRRSGEALREEIRRSGYVDPDYEGSAGTMRIRVRKRFDIVLDHHPSDTAPCTVDVLHSLRRKTSRGHGRGR
jgi:hypothetical protein